MANSSPHELDLTTAIGESIADAVDVGTNVPEDVLSELSPQWGYEMTIKALGRPLSPERFASLTSTEIERLRSTIQASLDAMREELAPDARALQVTADQVRDAVGRIVSRCPAS